MFPWSSILSSYADDNDIIRQSLLTVTEALVKIFFIAITMRYSTLTHDVITSKKETEMWE